MPDELETLLTRRMRSEVDDAHVDSTFLRSTLDGAVAARRRRRMIVTAGSGAAVAALVVAATITALSSSPEAPSPSEPADTRSTRVATGSVQPAHPYAWAGTLPRDLPPQVFILSGRVLRAPGLEYRFPSGSVSLVGTVRGGWLVRLYHAGTGAARYVVVPTAGHPTRLPRADAHVDGAAVSPDGQRVAYGGLVIDVATGRPVATMPGDARTIAGWIRPGVVYTDANGDARLWLPGGKRQRLGVRLAGPLGDGSALLDFGNTCGRVVSVSPDAVLTTLYQACDEAAPIGLSPRGTTVLTTGGEAVDLVAGSRTALPIPLAVAAQQGRVTWEDEHTIVFPVYRGEPSARVRFVRCTTPDGSCTLAGPSHVVK